MPRDLAVGCDQDEDSPDKLSPAHRTGYRLMDDPACSRKVSTSPRNRNREVRFVPTAMSSVIMKAIYSSVSYSTVPSRVS